jgi:hypothetical protein
VVADVAARLRSALLVDGTPLAGLTEPATAAGRAGERADEDQDQDETDEDNDFSAE